MRTDVARQKLRAGVRRRQQLAASPGTDRQHLQLGRASTYIKKPPYFDNMLIRSAHRRSAGSRTLARAGRFDHHGSHLTGRFNCGQQSRREISDRARRHAEGLQLLRRAARESRSDGARERSRTSGCAINSHRVPRARGLLHLPGGRQQEMFIYDAAMRYSRRVFRSDHRGQGIRLRIVAGLGGEGRQTARRQRRHRGEFRTHSPHDLVGWASCRCSSRRVRTQFAQAHRTRSVPYQRSPGRQSTLDRESKSGRLRRMEPRRRFRGAYRESTRHRRPSTSAMGASFRMSCGS